MRKTFIILVLFIITSISYAGHDNYPVGARQAGMSNATVMCSDIWSLWHNQAGLAYLKSTSIGMYYDNRYIVPEYAYKAFGLAVPTKRGVLGMSFSYFGYNQYNEKKIGLAYAKSFGEKFSAGLQLDYLNTYISQDYGSSGTVVVELGVLSQPVKNLFIAAHVYNPTRSSMASYQDERIPTIYRFGIGYKMGDKSFIGAEIEKELEFEPRIKAGIEYKLIDNFFLRTGISLKPVSNSFGIGYKLKGLILDIAFTTNKELGITPHVSMIYSF